MNRRGFLSFSGGSAAAASLGLLGCLFGRGRVRRVRRRRSRRAARQEMRTCKVDFVQDGRVVDTAVCHMDDLEDVLNCRYGKGFQIRVRSLETA